MSRVAAHLRSRDSSDEWYTPLEIIRALGPFDLDPAWFQRAISAAAGVFIFQGRIEFSRPDGSRGKCPLGCCLIPFGRANRLAVQKSGMPGLYLRTGY